MSPPTAAARGGDVCADERPRPAYPHAIVGAGLSGLLLARALLADIDLAPGAAPHILLIDPAPGPLARTTFAYWHRTPTPLDPWAFRTWEHLDVVDHEGTGRRVALDGWRYTAIDWAAARRALLAEVAADPRVIFLAGEVDAIRDGAQAAAVRCNGQWLTASWVYDSRPTRATGRPSALLQSFRGVWVETEVDCVDVGAATVLDFSADRGPLLGFAYVLPATPRSALVMAVRVGPAPGQPDPTPAVRRVVGTAPWRVVAEESGTTPLLSRPTGRRLGRRVLAIGTRGGRVRPSTGYAVTRILADSTAIATSLRTNAHPFHLPPDPRWMRALDDVWLRAVARDGAGMGSSFVELFGAAPVDSVLRFLEGTARPADLLRVVGALPPTPFLRAAVSRWPG